MSNFRNLATLIPRNFDRVAQVQEWLFDVVRIVEGWEGFEGIARFEVVIALVANVWQLQLQRISGQAPSNGGLVQRDGEQSFDGSGVSEIKLDSLLIQNSQDFFADLEEWSGN